jgi:hypothetical protein
MSAVCPTCGVAVVPGYVRCPKCHAGLSSGRIKRVIVDPGGTALPQRGIPISSIVVALGVAAAIIIVFGVRGGSKKTEAASSPDRASGAPEPVATAPDPPQTLIRPTAAAPAPEAPAEAVPDARVAVTELKATLGQQRLWGSVEVTGQRIDVRSGSCSDPAMRRMIEGKTSLLRGAGLTKLRCLEQSGAVVFERDL